MIEISRQYLEIKNIKQLKDTNYSGEECNIVHIKKPDFQVLFHEIHCAHLAHLHLFAELLCFPPGFHLFFIGHSVRERGRVLDGR